jgi:hypothetical protein
VGTPRFEWEEGVKEDAVILLRCNNWELTVKNVTVWRQKLWEAKGLIEGYSDLGGDGIASFVV